MALTNIENTESNEIMANTANEAVDIDLDLSVTRKKRIRINGDNTRILELNISDMNTIVRLKDDYSKLIRLANRVTKLKDKIDDETEEEQLARMADSIKSIDDEMRTLVDHIFDSNVSEMCAYDGSMYDLFNGKFRFEHIIEKLAELYGTNMKNEFKAVRARVQKHTGKYNK